MKALIAGLALAALFFATVHVLAPPQPSVLIDVPIGAPIDDLDLNGETNE